MRLFEGTPFDRPPVEDDPPEDLPAATPAGKQTANLAVEKRRKGKAVTVVRGLADEGGHLPGVLSKLQGACGAGGTVKDGVVEIQGRQLDKVRSTLQSLGYRVKG